MTTTLAPFGLRPVYQRHGGVAVRANTLPLGIASTYTTAIGIGDPIAPATDGTVILAVATSTQISGVFQGNDYLDSTNTFQKGYWPGTATTNTCQLVEYTAADDFGIVYEIQSNGALTQASIGDACNYSVGTPDSRSGQSTTVLVATSIVGSGNSAALKIVGLAPYPNNSWSDTYPIVQVIINTPSLQFRPGAAI